MRYLILLASMMLALPAAADMVARGSSGDFARLSDAPCSHPATLGHLRPGVREQFRKAAVMASGKAWEACLVIDAEGVFIMYEDGDTQRVDPRAFKAEPTV